MAISMLCLSIIWYFFFADEEDIKIMSFKLFGSFACMFVGGGIWWTRFPETFFTKERVGEKISKIV
jgi:hypothetical protein